MSPGAILRNSSDLLSSRLASWIGQHLVLVDGRGPLWWAYEYDRPDVVQLLVRAGADPAATDSLGMTPQEMQA